MEIKGWPRPQDRPAGDHPDRWSTFGRQQSARSTPSTLRKPANSGKPPAATLKTGLATIGANAPQSNGSGPAAVGELVDEGSHRNGGVFGR